MATFRKLRPFKDNECSLYFWPIYFWPNGQQGGTVGVSEQRTSNMSERYESQRECSLWYSFNCPELLQFFKQKIGGKVNLPAEYETASSSLKWKSQIQQTLLRCLVGAKPWESEGTKVSKVYILLLRSSQSNAEARVRQLIPTHGLSTLAITRSVGAAWGGGVNFLGRGTENQTACNLERSMDGSKAYNMGHGKNSCAWTTAKTERMVRLREQ